MPNWLTLTLLEVRCNNCKLLSPVDVDFDGARPDLNEITNGADMNELKMNVLPV